MNKNRKIVFFILLFLLIAGSILFRWQIDSVSEDNSELTPSPSSSVSIDDLGNLIQVDPAVLGGRVGPIFEVTGRARGYWFFEASFPVKIYDKEGVELGIGVAQAQPDLLTGEVNWMTEDFVSFKAILSVKRPKSSVGILVLEKDNPSGLPENSAELRIPIEFDLKSWPDINVVSDSCFVAGCSGQLCVEESEKDIVTTCEYKEEYACYKGANCKRQEDGRCGWTPTERLVACLAQAFQKESQ